MATFLAVPLKRTWEVDLQKPLKTFITSTFDKIDPEDYNKALQEFHKLRNNVIAKSVDRHESSLEILHRLVAVLTGGTGHCQVPSDSDLIGDSCFLFLICVKQFYRFLSSVIMRKCKLTGIWKLYYCSIHVNLHSFCWILDCLRLSTYLLLNWVNILLCISCLIYCWSKGHLCTF